MENKDTGVVVDCLEFLAALLRSGSKWLTSVTWFPLMQIRDDAIFKLLSINFHADMNTRHNATAADATVFLA
jgi:hypothetical protein